MLGQSSRVMMVNAKSFLFFLWLSVSILSCKEKGTGGNESSPTVEKGFQFRLNPAFNTPYKYEMVNETSSEQEINDTKTSNETKIEMALTYSVNRDSSGLYNFNMQYDKFKMHIKALDQEKEIDAETASLSFDPIEKIFGAFKNAAIQVQVDEKANVKKVTGFTDLTSRMRILANGNPDALQMLNSTLRQYVAEENIRSSFEKTFKPLPDKLLKEGDEWVVSQPISNDFRNNIDITYKVKSIKNEVVTITTNSDINLENQPTFMEGMSVTTNLKGTQKGEMNIERSTSMMLFSVVELNLKGNIYVIGREVPIKLKTKNAVRRINLAKVD